MAPELHLVVLRRTKRRLRSGWFVFQKGAPSRAYGIEMSGFIITLCKEGIVVELISDIYGSVRVPDSLNSQEALKSNGCLVWSPNVASWNRFCKKKKQLKNGKKRKKPKMGGPPAVKMFQIDYGRCAFPSFSTANYPDSQGVPFKKATFSYMTQNSYKRRPSAEFVFSYWKQTLQTKMGMLKTLATWKTKPFVRPTRRTRKHNMDTMHSQPHSFLS